MPRSTPCSASSGYRAGRTAKRPRSSASSSQSAPGVRRSARKTNVDPMAYNARYHQMDEATRPARARALRHQAGDYSQPKSPGGSDSSDESDDEATDEDQPLRSKCRRKAANNEESRAIAETSDDEDQSDSTTNKGKAAGLPMITLNKVVSKRLTTSEHRLLYHRAWEVATAEEDLQKRVQRVREAYANTWKDFQRAAEQGSPTVSQSEHAHSTPAISDGPTPPLFPGLSSEGEDEPHSLHPYDDNDAGVYDGTESAGNPTLNPRLTPTLHHKTGADRDIDQKAYSQQPAERAWHRLSHVNGKLDLSNPPVTSFSQREERTNTARQGRHPRQSLSHGFQLPLPASKYSIWHRPSRYAEGSERSSNGLVSTTGVGLSVSQSAIRKPDFDSDKENGPDLNRDVSSSP